MKKLLFTAFIAAFLSNIDAQTWSWSHQLSCSGNVNTQTILNDDVGNTFIGGTFKDGDLQIGGFTATYTAGSGAGRSDGFICMIDETGTVQWLKGLGGTHDDEVVSLQLVNGDLYAYGNFRNETCVFSGTHQLLNGGNWDSFLAQYRISDGEVLNVYSIFSGTGVERVKDFVYNEENDLFACVAQYQSPGISFDTVGGTPSSLSLLSGNKDLFVYTMNTIGEVINYKVYQTSVKQAVLKYIDHAPNNGYYIGADLYGTVRFNQADTAASNFATSSDVLLINIDSDLNYGWSRRGGINGYDHVNALISDENGFVYASGKVESDPYFQTNATDSVLITSSFGSTDMYILKYNQNGDLQWIDRKGNAGDDNASGLAIQENLVQYCGNFADSILFNNDTLRSSSVSDINTSFAIYDKDGSPVSAKAAGGTGAELGQEIGFNKVTGRTIIAGWFESASIDFNSELTNTSVIGTRDGFIAAYEYPFNASFTEIDEVTCNGGNNGRLLASKIYGVGPYTYDWSASTGSGDFNDSVGTNLTAGFYSLTITDSRSEQVTTTYTITEPDAFVITTDSTNITCNNSANGTLLASATGGTGTINYAWSGGNSVPGANPQTGLEPGKYLLNISDENGCSAKDSVTLSQPDKISFAGSTATKEDPEGSLTGALDLNISGGTAPYTLSWEDALGVMAGRTHDTLNQLQEGTYSAHIVDNNSCAADTSLVVPGALLRVILNPRSHITCYGLDNGVAFASISSGDKGEIYNFVFTDSLGNNITAIDDTVIQDLQKGWYYVTVQETGGELRIASDSLYISEPDRLILTLVADTVGCYGETTGDGGGITLLKEGGTGSVSYDWSNEQTSQSITNLAAGWYTVVATDENLCSVTDSAEVKQWDSLVVEVSIFRQIKCNGDKTGQIKTNITGGASPFKYTWDDPGLQSSAIATALSAGSYSVLVTDANNCEQSAGTTIGEPEEFILASVDTSHVTCMNAADGRIALNVQGGTEPYSFDWGIDGYTLNYLEGLAANFISYSVTAEDANGCTLPAFSFKINNPSAALVIDENTDEHVDVSCYGANDGRITLETEGGWGGYQYSMDETDWQLTPVFTGLGKGRSDFYVKDTSGCIVSEKFEIEEPDELNLLSAIPSGKNIFASAMGGTLPYSWSINGGASQTIGQFFNLAPGNYTVELMDANGCGPQSTAVDIITSLEKNQVASSNVYPNPTTGIIHFLPDENMDGEALIEIISLSGAVVFTNEYYITKGSKNPIVINLQNNAKGVYIIQLNGITLNSKIIIE